MLEVTFFLDDGIDDGKAAIIDKSFWTFSTLNMAISHVTSESAESVSVWLSPSISSGAVLQSCWCKLAIALFAAFVEPTNNSASV